MTPLPSRHHLNPTTRFSNRADAYHASRPSPPPSIIQAITQGLDTANLTAADLGAGTGLSSLALAAALGAGAHLYAIEPNADMRARGEQATGHDPRITWLNAPAEATTLPDASIDLVISTAAFHWFDPVKAPQESARILRLSGRLAVMTTDRDPADPIAEELHHLISKREPVVTAANFRETYGHAFSAAQYTVPRLITAHNPQTFTLARLLDRARSSSYWPDVPAEQHSAAEALKALHRRHADAAGLIHARYHTTALIAGRA